LKSFSKNKTGEEKSGFFFARFSFLFLIAQAGILHFHRVVKISCPSPDRSCLPDHPSMGVHFSSDSLIMLWKLLFEGLALAGRGKLHFDRR